MTGRPGDGQELLPLLDTGDLHEDDFATVLADHLPDLPPAPAADAATERGTRR